jgi:predicted nucleotidyltransferase
LTITEQNILKTLGYFDLFQYPLTKDEICLFHPVHVLHPAIDSALEILIDSKSVFKLDEFYSLQSDLLLAQRRRKGNMLAIEQMKKAGRVAKFLSQFPYVKGVAVSGSLSKNFADEKTDIDFFIITEANRLWIARTLMHLYKKLTFLTGRQHWFCMNYYVDEAAPEITEKNIFTAMETITLLPMQGKRSIDHFIAGNTWVKEFFPVKKISTTGTPEIEPGFFRRQIEKIFDSSWGDRFDAWLMNVTGKRWQKKMEQRRLNRSGHNMSMVVGPHVSKPDPKNFQDKVVESYQGKVQQLLQVNIKTASMIL